MNQGPTDITIPARSEKVCNGCAYLHSTPGLRGRNKVTNHFTCIHPEFQEQLADVVTLRRGRNIHLNHEGSCTTPDWCPFVQPKK